MMAGRKVALCSSIVHSTTYNINVNIYVQCQVLYIVQYLVLYKMKVHSYQYYTY